MYGMKTLNYSESFLLEFSLTILKGLRSVATNCVKICVVSKVDLFVGVGGRPWMPLYLCTFLCVSFEDIYSSIASTFKKYF
jgi:hypothetical protein